MQPKYRQTVKQLTSYYIAQGYNDFRLILYIDDYIAYNGCLECYTGEADGYDIKEFFCSRSKGEIVIYVEG